MSGIPLFPLETLESLFSPVLSCCRQSWGLELVPRDFFLPSSGLQSLCLPLSLRLTFTLTQPTLRLWALSFGRQAFEQSHRGGIGYLVI